MNNGTVLSERVRIDYHHIIPQCIYDKFKPEFHKDLNKLQISINRETHDLIEALNAPLVYLIENGIPLTDQEFKIFISLSSKHLIPYNDRLRENEIVEIICKSCGYGTMINPRSKNTKHCRNCGVQIYNIPLSESKVLV